VPGILDALARDYDVLIHFTPTASQRRQFSKQGVAMPDGSFYIRNASDLSNAINAVGRATPNASESEVARRNAVRRHIIQRASDLKLSKMIPDTWNADGTLKQSAAQGLGLPLTGVIVDELPDNQRIDELIDKLLEHHGVKGMHWGVRSARPSGGSGSSAAIKPSRGDRKWEDKAQDFKNMSKIHNAAVPKMNADLDKINNDPKFKGKDFTTPSPLRRQYYNAVQASMSQRYNEAASTMTNPSGSRKLQVDVTIFDNGEIENHLHPVDVKHADDAAKFSLAVKRGPNGHILSVSLSEPSMQQMDEQVDEFLSHFGVKGMHWGVRRSRPTGTATPPHTAPRPGKFRTVSAAPRRAPHRPVSSDAARTLQLKSQLKAHGPNSLSNQDLQHLVKRMQLENQLRNLSPAHKTAGRKVVDEAVKIGGNAAKQTAQQFAAKYAAEGAAHLIKLAIKMK
jgi:hypothetical protein